MEAVLSVLLLSFLHVCSVKACPHRETVSSYYYSEIPVPDLGTRSSIVFSIKACKDAHIALSETSYIPEATNMVEIVIGAGSNSYQRIGSMQGGGVFDLVYEALLSCNDYRDFWVSWNLTPAQDKSQVSLGLGQTVGDNVHMEVITSKPLVVNHISLASYGGTIGEWTFDFPEQTNPDACPLVTIALPVTTSSSELDTSTAATTTMTTLLTATSSTETSTSVMTAPPDALSTSTIAMTSTTETPTPTITGVISSATSTATTTTMTTTLLTATSSTETSTSVMTAPPDALSTSTIAMTSTTETPTPTATGVIPSATVIPTSQNPSLTSQPTTLAIPTQQCKCIKVTNTTQPGQDKALQLAVAEIKKNLTLEAETSAQRRSRTSAPDYRPSSQAIGAFGTVLLAVVFGLIVFSDLISLWDWLAKTRSTGANKGGDSGEGRK